MVTKVINPDFMPNAIVFYARHMGWEIPDKYEVQTYIDGVGESLEGLKEYYEDRPTRISLYACFCMLYSELFTLRRIPALEFLYEQFSIRREVFERQEIANALYATEKKAEKIRLNYVYDRLSRVLRDRELIANSTPQELLDKIAW